MAIAAGVFLAAFGQQNEGEGASANLVEQGQEIYQSVCAACHQPEGQGVEGAFPALAGNAFVLTQPPDPAIQVVLTGRGGMPRFADTYSNTQIAAVLTYVRQAWGNSAPAVSPEEVEAVRQQLAGETEEAEGGGQGEGTDGGGDNGTRDDQGEDGQDTQNGDGN